MRARRLILTISLSIIGFSCWHTSKVASRRDGDLIGAVVEVKKEIPDKDGNECAASQDLH